MDKIYTMVDTVLLTIKNKKLHVALVKRDREPRMDEEALPGGRIEEGDEDAMATALRVLQTKASIDSPYLEQLKTYTGKKRDSRSWSISIAYYAVVPLAVIEAADHAGVRLVAVDKLGKLPFDHNEMVAEAVARVRNKSAYSSLPCYLAGEKFTIPQLHAVYQSAMGEPLTLTNFRRKIKQMEFIEEVDGEFDRSKPARPAQLFRLQKKYRKGLRVVERGL